MELLYEAIKDLSPKLKCDVLEIVSRDMMDMVSGSMSLDRVRQVTDELDKLLGCDVGVQLVHVSLSQAVSDLAQAQVLSVQTKLKQAMEKG